MVPPPSKVIPGTGFLVDGFRFADPSVRAYLLSHAHADHYTGLMDTWDKGLIYCSDMTAKLIAHKLGVDQKYLCALPMDIPQNVDGVEVTLVDANHCPGAVQFLFRLPNGKRYIHCGDMRFCPAMLANPHLRRFQGANAIFLDTTYCNPKHTFPDQEESINYVVNTILNLMKKASESGLKHLFLISTYGIGKERILLKVHHDCRTQIFVTKEKYGVLSCIDFEDIKVEDLFVTDPESSNVHVVKWGILGETWPYFRPNFVNMEAEGVAHGAAKVVGFVPTGWAHHSGKADFPIHKKNNCEIHLVPYSEHSSYDELREFVKQMKPEKIIPTVGVSGEDGERKEVSILKHFRNLVDETASKARFIESMKKVQEKPVRNSEDMGNGPQCTSTSTSLDRIVVKSLEKMEVDNDILQDEGNFGKSKDIHTGEDGNSPSTLEQSAPCQLEAVQGIEQEDCTKSPSESNSLSTMHDEMSAFTLSDRGKQSEANTCASEHCAGQISTEDVKTLGGVQAEKHLNDKTILGKRKGISLQESHRIGVLHEEPPCNFDSKAPSSAASTVDQLVNILSGQISREAAGRLLKRVGGKLEVAINAFYEPQSVHYGAAGGQQLSRNTPLRKVTTKSVRTPPKKRSRRGVDQPSIRAFFSPVSAQDHARLRTDSNTAATMRSDPESKPEAMDIEGVVTTHSINTEKSSKDQSRHCEDGCGSGNRNQGGSLHTSQGRSLSCIIEGVPLAAPIGVMDLKIKPAVKDCPSLHGQRHVELGGMPPNSTCMQESQGKTVDELSQADLRELFLNFPKHPEDELTRSKNLSSVANGTLHTKLDQTAAVEGHALLYAPSTIDLLNTGPEILPLRSVEDNDGACESNDMRKDAVLSSIHDYDPVKDACWVQGEPMPYLHVARALTAVSSTTKRLKISDGLTNMFRSVLAIAPDHLLETVYLACGKIAPDHLGVELNVGGSIVSLSICEATGSKRSKLRGLYREKGDLGDVAQACGQSQRRLLAPEPLTVPKVFQNLKLLASEKGTGSVGRRKQIMTAMLRACRECEICILVRTLIQNLRIGASWLTVVGALGRAAMIHEKGISLTKSELDEAASSICESYHMCPCFDVLVPALIDGGIEEAKLRCTLTPGIPVKPMLAKISSGVGNALSNFDKVNFLAEFKYDGMRAQIHLEPGGAVSIFSRNCETRTASFPDVASAVQKAVDCSTSSIVLDAELVAVDRARGNRLMAFQDLSHRQRGSVSESEVTIAVCVFAFDILYLNGEVLTKQTLRERRRALTNALVNLKEGVVELAKSIEVSRSNKLIKAGEDGSHTVSQEERLQAGTEAPEVSKETDSNDDPDEEHVHTYLLHALSSGAEGLMLKELDGPSSVYESSKRSDHWLKIKSDYCDGLHDSLDVVPIGAWRGNGRKVKWFSPFLVAIWDPRAEEFQSICRCMSGFTDTFYTEATARLSKKIIPGPKTYYRTRETPSIWFDPCEVWEIKGADLTVSPVHQAAVGMVHNSKGVGLRFPRFIQVRDDKDPVDATSPDVIADLFLKQNRRVATSGEGKGEPEDSG